LPFRLATDLSLEPVHYTVASSRLGMGSEAPGVTRGARYIAGGHFAFTSGHAEILLQSLPPIVHIRRESDKTAMRWSLERMREELSNPQPGASLMAQHLAYTMLIQALRLHLADSANRAPGWLSALSDKQMSIAVASIHKDPGHPWTLQSLAERVGMSRSVFALRFRETAGVTPMEYLTRWRMLLAADRLKNSSDGLSAIAQSLGYQSESAFGKAFRRTMGCSPRQYTRTAPHAVPVQHSAEDYEQVCCNGVGRLVRCKSVRPHKRACASLPCAGYALCPVHHRQARYWRAKIGDSGAL